MRTLCTLRNTDSVGLVALASWPNFLPQARMECAAQANSKSIRCPCFDAANSACCKAIATSCPPAQRLQATRYTIYEPQCRGVWRKPESWKMCIQISRTEAHGQRIFQLCNPKLACQTETRPVPECSGDSIMGKEACLAIPFPRVRVWIR